MPLNNNNNKNNQIGDVKDSRASVGVEKTAGEEKTTEQMVNMIRGVKSTQITEALTTKKNTPVESLKRKRTEPGTTSARKHTEVQEKRLGKMIRGTRNQRIRKTSRRWGRKNGTRFESTRPNL